MGASQYRKGLMMYYTGRSLTFAVIDLTANRAVPVVSVVLGGQDGLGLLVSTGLDGLGLIDGFGAILAGGYPGSRRRIHSCQAYNNREDKFPR